MQRIFSNKIIFMFLFIFINLFLLDLYLPIMLFFHIPQDKVAEVILSNLSFCYFCIVFINRIYLLPLYLNLWEKYTLHYDIKLFIYKLKYSLKMKLSFLLVSFFISPILCVIYDFIISYSHAQKYWVGTFELSLLFAPLLGLYQVYIIMYFYWWFEKIIKKLIGNEQG